MRKRKIKVQKKKLQKKQKLSKQKISRRIDASKSLADAKHRFGLMRLSVDTVKHVSAIARLDLSESEIKKFQKDLNDILVAFKDLDKAKPKCKPSFQPLPIKDVMREDAVEKTLSRERALENTKHKEVGFFKGPRVV